MSLTDAKLPSLKDKHDAELVTELEEVVVEVKKEKKEKKAKK